MSDQTFTGVHRGTVLGRASTSNGSLMLPHTLARERISWEHSIIKTIVVHNTLSFVARYFLYYRFFLFD